MQSASSGISEVMACCFFIPFLGIGLAFLFLNLKFQLEDAPAALHKWAKENGHRLREANVRWYLRGPFIFTSGGWQAVFRVTVEPLNGHTKRGWVRVGDYWWPRTDRIEVVWDPARPEPVHRTSQPSEGHPPMWDPDLDTRGS